MRKYTSSSKLQADGNVWAENQSANGFGGGGLRGVAVFECDVAEQGSAFGCLTLNMLITSRDITGGVVEDRREKLLESILLLFLLHLANDCKK